MKDEGGFMGKVTFLVVWYNGTLPRPEHGSMFWFSFQVSLWAGYVVSLILSTARELNYIILKVSK